MEERDKLELELAAIKDILTAAEEGLRELHSENRQTTHLAILVMVLAFFLYCIYCVIVNEHCSCTPVTQS